MKIILSLVLLVGVITTGCRSPARKLEPTAMGQIQEGRTTRAEVEKIFGAPYRVTKISDQKTLTLHKRQQNRHNPDWRGPVTANAGAIVLRGLTIIYDANQTVEKFLFSQSITPVRRDEEGLLVGWSPARADFTKIIKGITSRGELILWYGAPTMQTMTIDGELMLVWAYLRKAERFRIDNREQEFRVIVDDQNFVKDFGMIGDTNAPTY